MSTYWHYECLDHPGGLISEEEFTQHTDDSHFERGIQLIAQRPVERDERYWSLGPLTSDSVPSDAYFEMQARRFLHEHPTCRLGVISESGTRRDVAGQELAANRPPQPFTTLAEHLLDPALPVDAQALSFPTLHIQHQKTAVNISTAIFYLVEGVAAVLVNGMLRPAQFDAMSAEVAAFNDDPRAGWAGLAAAAAAHLVDEQSELDQEAAALRRRAQQLAVNAAAWS